MASPLKTLTVTADLFGMSFGKVRRTNIRVVSAVAIILACLTAQYCTGNILRSVGYHETRAPGWVAHHTDAGGVFFDRPIVDF
jgi:hypothetical protein